jgi:methylated-DNA-[protein]-cysteine S-methyltransferase
MAEIKFKIIKSPVGHLKIVVTDRALIAILWDNEKPNRVKLDAMREDNNDALILEIEKQLNEYFQKKRKVFNLPIEMQGTPFQRDVWRLLSEIPYGSTCSYQEIAHQLQHPKAVRAVGAANGRNPISIIIPCHRVIAANGSLSGFAGGIERKKILLDLEKGYI